MEYAVESGKRTAAVFNANVHDLFPLLSQRVAIGNKRLKFGACIVDRVGVETLLDQRIAVFFG
jgi:hypothetical protein